MGSKYPTSFKLGKYNIWNSILYKFNLGHTNNISAIIQKNIIKSINHYFQNIIISKPQLYFENNILKIKIFYFIKFNPTTPRASFSSKLMNIKQYPCNHAHIIKFEKLLKKFYGFPVEFQLIKLNNPTFNANILAQLIAINLKSHGLVKIWRILLRKIKLKTPITKNMLAKGDMVTDSKKMVLSGIDLNWMHILNKGIFCKEFYSYITGFKIKLSGRISKRRGASRTTTINRSIGTLQQNSIHSYIDYGHVEKKDKNGSQSIKVYIASSVYFSIFSL